MLVVDNLPIGNDAKNLKNDWKHVHVRDLAWLTLINPYAAGG